MDVSIVIVNYNTIALTRQCILSVFQFSSGFEFEIIVVDNASTEPGASELQKEFDKIILIKSSENIGFAGGNNLGIERACGEYVLLLNSDTYLIENTILKTMCFLQKHRNVGVVSAQLVYPDGRVQSVAQRFPSIKYQLIEILRLQKLLPRSVAGRLLLGAFFNHQSTTEADWVWGAYFMFPKSLLQQLPKQKLDDEYFMYWEDVQWCMDIKKLGYSIYYFADSKVVHIHEGSKGKKNELMVKNEDLFFRRNYSSLHRLVIQNLRRLLS